MLNKLREEHRDALKWATILTGLYVGAQLIADVSAVKLLTTSFGIIPGGTYIFAVTFTLRDMLHRRAGKWVALWAVLIAAIVNIGLVIYSQFMILHPAAPFWLSQDAFIQVFSAVPLITFASIVAEVVSEVADTYVYDYIYRKSHVWGMLVSNTVGVLIDSAIFISIAFMGQPIAVLFQMSASTALFKFAVAIVSALFVWLFSREVESNAVA